MAYRDPQDQRAAVSRHYQANKEIYKARARAHTTRERERVKEFLRSYLADHPCIDCGEHDPIVLEFDHREGVDKKFTLGDSVRTGHSLRSVMAEVDKCDVRCANCHRRITYRRAGRTHRG